MIASEPSDPARSGWWRARRAAKVAVVALAIVVSAAGCGRKEFADRTARVTIDGVTTEFQVDHCGLDGQTVFVVGRTEQRRILQAVVGVEADHRTGVLASTGLTVTASSSWEQAAPNQGVLTTGDLELGAFGEESWARRGMEGAPPGEIHSARVRGSRIQVGGLLEPVPTDDDAAPAPAPPSTGAGGSGPTSTSLPALPFSLDARCDLR